MLAALLAAVAASPAFAQAGNPERWVINPGRTFMNWNLRALRQSNRETFEGAARPGHFDGMLAVVARLFELVNPDFAVFGAKDAQQLFLIKRMAAKAFPDLHIIEAPIVRETSGLAMSSRNRYLDETALSVAGQLSKALQVGKAAAETLGAKPSLAVNAARARLDGVPEAKLDYLALVDPSSFEQIDDSFTGRALMLIAAVVGNTRLIDNLTIDFQEPFA